MALLDAQTLARLAGVRLRARAVMEGVLSGLHKSPHQGQSVEFAEHKEYAPGDELRHMDWKAYGKFDRYYVKRFEHETNLRASLVVDASASMDYRSGALSKLEVATTLAGALAYLLVRQQDAVGVTLLSDGASREVPPRASAGHLNVVLDALEQAKAEGSADLLAATDRVAEALRGRALICVFSDLFDAPEGALDRLLSLRRRRNDVVVFQVLDPDELEFPFDDPTRFLAMEDARFIEAQPRELKESYLESFHAFLETTRKACAEAGADYERVRTDEPLDQVLLRFLARRQGRR